MQKEKHTWKSILALIIAWTMIIGVLGAAFYYKWNHPDPYEPDIEHR